MGTVGGVPPVSAARITLPDRYRVVRHLANGGMASVWEARDELLDRAVAVKVLASHLSEDERARRRFQREARAVAGLSSHPNVVTIYDVGEHDGRSFIVMELLGGGSVADRIRGGRRVPLAEALQWLGEAGEALDAAHAAEIVHRDVKPGNMLLDERGRLALADFGIARVAWEDQLTQTGQVLGTAAYISPEQAMGDAGDGGLGPLLPGRRRVRAADRAPAVRGRALRRPGPRARRGRPAGRVGDRRGPPAGRRRRAVARAGQAPRGALADLQGVRRGARERAGAAPAQRGAGDGRDAADDRPHPPHDGAAVAEGSRSGRV